MIRVIKNWPHRIMRHIVTDMSAASSNLIKSYEEAVCTLNTLQSNAVTLEKAKEDRNKTRHLQIPKTVEMMERAGLTLDDIDKLSIIHVSGTKGKGSTCAFCESILRHHGYKTGFFSSPHLVEVRERIRINGKPLSRDAFTTYFWDCYTKLDASKADYGGEMPAYFKFLTIMAFHVFLQEKVDVAIMEVGIGGQYDCTNVIRSPVVCGVTSLGMDHLSILGNTIDKIAWQKAGIFKPGVPAVTVPQPDNSIEVLKERAVEIGNPLYMAPSYNEYQWNGSPPANLGIEGEMQKLNASLAMQLCKIWLQNHAVVKEQRQALYASYIADKERQPEIELADHFTVSPQYRKGLELCRWAGRNQKLKRPGVTYYIDGAHTNSSVQQCAHWFMPESAQEAKTKSGKVAKVLLFNVTGERDPATLLCNLVECDFDCALFCPNIASRSADKSVADQRNLMVTLDSQLEKCIKSRNAWLKLLNNNDKCTSWQKAQKSRDTNTSDIQNAHQGNSLFSHTASDTKQKLEIPQVHGLNPDHPKSPQANGISGHNKLSPRDFSDSDSGIDSGESSQRSSPEQDIMPCYVFNTIQESVQWLSEGRDPEMSGSGKLEVGPLPKVLTDASHIQVLCVGSLHLVGGLIGLLDPHINEP